MDGRCKTDGAAAGWMAQLRTYGTEGGPQMVQHEDGRWYLPAQAEDERKEKLMRWVGERKSDTDSRGITMVNTDNSHDLSPIGSQVKWFPHYFTQSYNSWLTARGLLLPRLLTWSVELIRCRAICHLSVSPINVLSLPTKSDGDKSSIGQCMYLHTSINVRFPSILKVRLHGVRQAARLTRDMLQCDLLRGKSIYLVGSCGAQLLHIIHVSAVFGVSVLQRKLRQLLATACVARQL